MIEGPSWPKERPETKLPMSVWDRLSHPYWDELMEEPEELCFSYKVPVLPNFHTC